LQLVATVGALVCAGGDVTADRNWISHDPIVARGDPSQTPILADAPLDDEQLARAARNQSVVRDINERIESLNKTFSILETYDTWSANAPTWNA
jgi:hypothetical protein